VESLQQCPQLLEAQFEHSYPSYTLPFGDTEIVVVSDGPLDLGAPEGSFRVTSKDEIDEQLLLRTDSESAILINGLGTDV
jgi:hypothetical protein